MTKILQGNVAIHFLVINYLFMFVNLKKSYYINLRNTYYLHLLFQKNNIKKIFCGDSNQLLIAELFILIGYS